MPFPAGDTMTTVVNNPQLASALHLERSETINPFFPLSQGLTMSTPNNRFVTISAENLATATGGLTAAAGGGSTNTNNWQLKHQLSPILHSLRDLNSSSSNNQNQQNQTMMMGMMAAVLARRD